MNRDTESSISVYIVEFFVGIFARCETFTPVVQPQKQVTRCNFIL